jgi:hypothetical protein
MPLLRISYEDAAVSLLKSVMNRKCLLEIVKEPITLTEAHCRVRIAVFSQLLGIKESTIGLQRCVMSGRRNYHVQRVSAKHGVKDDFAFPWEHAIFRHPPNKNPFTDRSEILQS